MEHHNNEIVPIPQKERKESFWGFRLQPGDEQLLEFLSDEQRAVLLAEGPYEERAKKLGVPVGTIRSRTNRARAALTELRRERGGAQSSERGAQPH